MEPQSQFGKYPSTITEWLTSFGLSQYSTIFQENGYEDLDCLWNISSEDLEQIGVQLAGHRKKLLCYASRLNLSASNKQNSSGERNDLKYEIWKPDFLVENSTQNSFDTKEFAQIKDNENIVNPINHDILSNSFPIYKSFQTNEYTESGADDIMKQLEELNSELDNELNQDLRLKNTADIHESKTTKKQLIVIQVFRTDMVSSMSIEIENSMQSWYVTHQLILQHELVDSPNWGLIEVNSQFSLQRMLEDHEIVANTYTELLSQQSLLILKEDNYKYDLFHRSYEYFPAQLCLPIQQTEDPLDARVESARKLIIDGYLSDIYSVPELRGDLFLRDGKRNWKQKFFELRASGLYFSRSGKCRQEKHLSLLCSINNYTVYIAANYKKTINAPYEYCFVLKPLKKKIGWEDLKCFSATSKRVMFSWIAGIRLAKEGGALLRHNFVSMSDKVCKLEVMRRGKKDATTISSHNSQTQVKLTPISPSVTLKDKYTTANVLPEPDHFITKINTKCNDIEMLNSDQRLTGHKRNVVHQPSLSPIDPMVDIFSVRKADKVIPTEQSRINVSHNTDILTNTTETVTNPWFHGAITKNESAARITSVGGTDGTFLIRESTSNKGSFVLTMIYQYKFYHYIIINHGTVHNASFSIDYGPRFPKLQELYQYYSRSSDGMPCKLSQLCINSSYEDVVSDTL
ncbi:Growth factor receptor-bound protein 14-like [Oopsacas minuta]|uniref:Growth factor receptor-bound protein 14-like n=1 Tax=Oopsacas minuta TaxID=111878 RepID=A0AAV7JLC3_9METZ|nr:Growth factor receptor-bound protein 14-like [Oopsacas minuta]